MARGKVEVGLTVSFLLDVPHECDDSEELDGVVDPLDRDDADEIVGAIMGEAIKDQRYDGLCAALFWAIQKVRDRYPDTHFDATLYPFNGLSEGDSI